LELVRPVLTTEQYQLFAEKFQVFIEARLTMLTLNDSVIWLWKGLVRDFPEIGLYALSNTDITCWPYIQRITGIPFHGGVMSFETGFRKPDPRIFDAAIQLVGLPPDQCFFTDDINDFVISAGRRGMEAHWYDPSVPDRNERLSGAVLQFLAK
jgi:putative hydrolase of the HAD superfamily